jgi:hypothetical protein
MPIRINRTSKLQYSWSLLKRLRQLDAPAVIIKGQQLWIMRQLGYLTHRAHADRFKTLCEGGAIALRKEV